MRTIFTIGVVLLLLSAYPLYLMAAEIVVSTCAYQRYEMEQHRGANYDYKSAEFHGHRAIFSGGTSVNGKPTISTTVDGKDYSLSSPVGLDDRGGFHGWAAMLTLRDRQNNEERLAIVQRVARESYPDDTRYRILFVQPNGTVTEEWFSYPERHDPIYRAMLAQYVHPEPLGFYSQVLSYWPTIFYPIIYPWLTGLVGFILSVVGGIVLLRRRRRGNVAPP
jgi:hypothetical protein